MSWNLTPLLLHDQHFIEQNPNSSSASRSAVHWKESKLQFSFTISPAVRWSQPFKFFHSGISISSETLKVCSLQGYDVVRIGTEYRRFGEAYCLHLQGTAINMYSNIHGVFCQLKIITDFMYCVNGATKWMLSATGRLPAGRILHHVTSDMEGDCRVDVLNSSCLYGRSRSKTS
jgi:uncharacterized membrane protein YecN with MAPEG domain